jgi:hypothetical protein
MDVVVWLRSLGLGKYEAAFRMRRPCRNLDLKELGAAASESPAFNPPPSDQGQHFLRSGRTPHGRRTSYRKKTCNRELATTWT